jgi:hypothetical protein
MQIHIKRTPSGEAPEHIRQAWINLVIPVPPRFAGRQRAYTFGVLSGPKSRFGKLFAALVGLPPRKIGYVVESGVALNLLAARTPEAAEWWRLNAPHFFEAGHYFLFDADSCDVVS